MIERMRWQGYAIACVTAIRDDIDEIIPAFRFALSLSPDMIVVAGGLGPAPDVTRRRWPNQWGRSWRSE